MTDANGVDKIQLTLCVLAALSIVTLWALDLYLGIG